MYRYVKVISSQDSVVFWDTVYITDGNKCWQMDKVYQDEECRRMPTSSCGAWRRCCQGTAPRLSAADHWERRRLVGWCLYTCVCSWTQALVSAENAATCSTCLQPRLKQHVIRYHVIRPTLIIIIITIIIVIISCFAKSVIYETRNDALRKRLLPAHMTCKLKLMHVS